MVPIAFRSRHIAIMSIATTARRQRLMRVGDRGGRARRCLAHWALLGSAAAAMLPLGAQDTPLRLVLVIRDATSGAPLPDAAILGPKGEELGKSDVNGVARLSVRLAAPAVLAIRKVGYQPGGYVVSGLVAADSTTVGLTSRDAATLDKVVVVGMAPGGRYADFERRRQVWSRGLFVTDSMIERLGIQRTISIFRRYPSIKVIDSSGTLMVASARSGKPVIGGGRFDLAPCVLQVVVDNVALPWGFDLDRINPREIHGIEVYPGPASIPPQFASTRRDAMCGMIVIWTK